jgi:hypothetical protein
VDAKFQILDAFFWIFHWAHLFSPLLTMYESRWKCRNVRQSI